MNTFLQYVYRRLYGPPISDHGNGEWYINCPHCDSTRCHTLPRHQRYPDKWNCFSCTKFGDEEDLLRYKYPDSHHADRLIKLADYRKEYEALTNGNHDHNATNHLPDNYNAGKSSFSVETTLIGPSYFNLSSQQLADILTVAKGSPDGLARDFWDWVTRIAKYHRAYLDWVAKTDQEHYRECQDPECEARVCRAARGLPALTREELEARKPAMQAARRLEQEQQKQYQRERMALFANRIRNRSSNGTVTHETGRSKP